MGRKILVVGPSWVGDMMMAQTLLKVLMAQDNSNRIFLLAPTWSKALASRMPEVIDVIESPFQHGELNLSRRRWLGKQLRSAEFEEAYVLPNSFKSALIPFFAHIPKRIGWRGEWRYGLLNDVRVLDEKKYPLMIQRFIALGLPKNAPLPSHLPYPELSVNPENVQKSLSAMQLSETVLDQKAPILAMCPGAEFGPSKRWPEEYFANVAKDFLSKGWQVWLFGSPKERAIAEKIQSITNHQCVDMIGKTSLDIAIDLISCASKVLTNDSGLMHIAAALNKPLVAVYGSTSTAFTPPLGEKVKILKEDLPCMPCFQRECPLKHHRCMRDLKPESVIKAIEVLE